MGVFLLFGMPMGAKWLCILAFFGLLAAGAVAAIIVQSRESRRRPSSAFPVEPVAPAGPGRFKVSGVERATKKDTVWYCEADSAANAQVKAELEGIIVTAVERV